LSEPLLQVEDKQIDAEALLARVREKVKNAGTGPLVQAAPVASGRALSGTLQEIDRALARASERWAVGAHVPPMHNLKGLLRKLATPAAKGVLRMAQLITRDQRDFNEAVLHAIRQVRALLPAQLEELKRTLELEAQKSATLNQLEDERRERESELARLRAENQAQRGVLEALRAELLQLDRRLKDEVTRREEVRHGLVLQEGRLTVLIEEARRRLPAPLDSSQLQMFAAEGQKLREALYPAFEDAFRGTPDEIRLRLGAYLPLLREAKAGEPHRPIVDIGCGRGELLDLLAENGLEAIGVDINDEMLERARARGLKVAKGDAVSHLRALPDASLGAVTAIHVIEHLPIEAVLVVFEECARVLRPGGIAIFETPNPENVLVGACNFYMDPTHIRPLHPSTMRYLAEARGLTRVRVEYFRPMSVPALEGTPGTEWIKEKLLGPQDYAVIGYRP
jgi:O-antigen chain-terminating methyltransferase